MTIRRSRKSAQTSTIWHQHTRKQREKIKQRRLLLECLEERRVLAAGPDLASIEPNNGPSLVNNAVLKVAPTELTFRFSNEVPQLLDPTSLSTSTYQSSVRLVRAGNDGQFTSNNVPIAPGYISTGDTGMEIVMRFAEPLPDDKYRIIIVGAGTGKTLRDTAGNRFNDGQNFQRDFTLELGAQVTAVVPQPVVRNASGALVQQGNKIDVYFNNDKLNKASAENVNFFQLIITRNTVSPADDSVIKPTSVVYTAAQNKATLTFANNLSTLNPNNFAIRLRVGTNQTLDTTIYPQVAANDPLSTFGGALNVGTLTTGNFNRIYGDSISPKPYDIVWPGGNDDPGHRDNPTFSQETETRNFGDDLGEKHLDDGQADGTIGTSIRYYNFKNFLGMVSDGRGGSQPSFNVITENQKQRAREVFELYSRYSGIQFVESQDLGLTVGTGDLRVVAPTIPSEPGGVAGLGGGSIAIMDSAETWSDGYGESWFQTAMHEIGHSLGLGHTYDLAPLTIMGDDGSVVGQSPGAEGVFPGDNDIVHMQRIYRPEGQDIDMYRFTVAAGQTGVFSAETFAERLQNSSSLDTFLRLYRGSELIASNDDYFSKDSLLQLQLGAGTYYLGVSAKGNEQYDPTVWESGMGGTSEGDYRLSMNFRPNVASANTIVDAAGTQLDGDFDGAAGGVFNFWFKTAPVIAQGATSHTTPKTLFVDRAAPNGGNGSLATPFNNISTALSRATVAGDIVRIVGNGGQDGALGTVGDNQAYEIGFDAQTNAPLRDGASLLVPKNVTVMVDAGAILQMRRGALQVGSSESTASTDRSGGALQILGTPGQNVFFTSYNDQTIGRDTRPSLTTSPTPGDWGGLLFRNDLDNAGGRFNWEDHGIFLNYVNYADIRYGGGSITVDNGEPIINAIHMVDARPTVTNNVITRNRNAAMSATLNSFAETNFREPIYQRDGQYAASFNVDYGRIGPEIHGNKLSVVQGAATHQNTLNGLLVRAATPAGSTLQELTVPGRFNDTDIVHIVTENLVINGSPSGPYVEGGTPTSSDPTINDSKPPVALVTIDEIEGGGTLSAGTYRYRLVFVDQFGNEGRASDVKSVTISGSGNGIRLGTELIGELPAIPSRFVGIRVYRQASDNSWRFVDQVAASAKTFTDTGKAPLFDRVLRNPGNVINRPRPDASLKIDPNIVLKFDSGRIEVEMGATLIAEGLAGQSVIFTSLSDDRFGTGGTFDTRGDGDANPPDAGEWGGIYAAPHSRLSLDRASIFYGGGLVQVNGDFAGFNAVEVQQADARIANTLIQFNANGMGGTAPGGRFGRGSNGTGSIFVRGAQPVIINNIIRDNLGAAVNINVNALNSNLVTDGGRQSGRIDRMPGHFDNHGPLVDENRLVNNALNGMVVRGGVLTTESVWDDTDIAHVLFDLVSVTDVHTFGGLRLESSAQESLVVKAQGATAGFYVNGRPLETDDRIGGILQVLGQPGFPVVMTSLLDDTVGAGFQPDLSPMTDTNNDDATGGDGVLPTGPEVNNGLLIDNDVSPNTTPGFFAYNVGEGGESMGGGGVTAQGNTQLFVNEDFIFDHINYVDVGSDGGAVSLGDTTITMAPTLVSPDLVVSEGNFAGPNGLVNWRVESSFQNGVARLDNKIILSSTEPLGDIRFINYLDEDVLGISDDLLYLTGTPGQDDFRAFTLDNDERVGFAQGGFTGAQAGILENATYTGWAADQYSELRSAITGSGTSYTIPGNIDLGDLPAINDPSLGTVYGLNDVTTAFAWNVAPTSNSATISSVLELVASDPGTAGAAGDWQGIVIDKYAHDRNVDTILESERTPGRNDTTGTSQTLGSLASFQNGGADNLDKSFEFGGDENLRLGFTVHGNLASKTDLDVYKFRGIAGSQVWVDIDRTTSSLNTIVEVIDSTGTVIARSNNSHDNSGLAGAARKMQAAPPFQGRDFFTTNKYDAGMRLVLPGTLGQSSNYFVRVRSSGSGLNSGLTQGSYQMQIRLQEKDEFGGTVVRYADINFATNGIDVRGFPTHSPLSGEHVDVEPNGGTNDTLGTAQNVGNVLNVDRGALSIAGELASETDVDWYQFNLDVDKIQGFGEPELLYSMMFDIDYADGLGRANTVISVFNSLGQLILSSKDSNVADDQPPPLDAAGVSDLLRGSVGTTDALIGPIFMPAGVANAAFPDANNSQTYYVAVSSDAFLPPQWDQFFSATSAEALARFQPLDSVHRIVEDHFDQSDLRGTSALPEVEIFIDGQSAVPFHLGDVTMYVNTRNNSGGSSFNVSHLYTADPFTGAGETTVGSQSGHEIEDIAFRGNDNQLFGFGQGLNKGTTTDANSGHFVQINTGTGAATDLGDDGMVTYEELPDNTLVVAHDLGNNNRVGWGVQYEALLFADLANGDNVQELIAVGRRGDSPTTGDPNRNILYHFNTTNGQPLRNNGPIQVSDDPDDWVGALTSGLEVGEIDTSLGLNGEVTGMAKLPNSSSFFAVDDEGGLYRVSVDLNANLNGSINSPSTINQVTTTYITSSRPDLEGIDFQALTKGPATVEGGRYAQMLFGVSAQGRMYAFNTDGQLQPIFAGGATSIQLRDNAGNRLTSVRGLAFGELERNLWGKTTARDDDPGHGLPVTFNDSVRPASDPVRTMPAQEPDGTVGNNASYGFNNYNFNGGAYGTSISNEFSLKGYSSADLPTLYYTYFLNSEDLQSTSGRELHDAARVFIAGDDGNWQLLSGDDREAEIASIRGEATRDVLGNRIFDNAGTWRQVRINLGNYAGQENLRLRFDFSTAGGMNVGHTQTTGDELRAVAGEYITDGDIFTVTRNGSPQDFEFDTGVTIFTRPGTEIRDGDTVTIVSNGVTTTFEFDRGDGVADGNLIVFFAPTDTARIIATRLRDAIEGNVANATVRYLSDDRLNLDFLDTAADTVTESSGGRAMTLVGQGGVTAGNIRVPVHREMTRDQVAVEMDRFLERALSVQTLAVQGLVGQFDDGEQFRLSVDGQDFDFEFDNNNATAPGFTAVTIGGSISQLARNIQSAVASALSGTGHTASYNSADRARVALQGRYAEVFTYNALSGSFPLSLMDPVDVVKTHKDLVRIINESVVSPGPLGLDNDLDGDVGFRSTGNFFSNTRGQNNAFEGFYIDDIIIGLAERGEMVTGSSTNTGFIDNLGVQENQNLVGGYQLEMRRGADYQFPTEVSTSPSFNTNQRLNASVSITAPNGAAIVEGSTFTLSDSVHQVTFEFDFNGSVRQGNIPVPFTADDTANVVASSIRDAINSFAVQQALDLSAQSADGVRSGISTNDQVNVIAGKHGKYATFVSTDGLPAGSIRYNNHRYGDSNRYRDQGQLILDGNRISNSANWGIVVDDAARDNGAPHTGPARVLSQPNNTVPGVVISNNVVSNSGTGGIRYSGSANAAGEEVGSVPFGRIINNTLYGVGGSSIGIQVDDNAAPTIVNNIVANFGTGVSVANSPGTVLDYSVYQSNGANVNGIAVGGSDILLQPTDPLFVDAANGNFYPAAGSAVIDNSINVLADRTSMVTVRNPLGIPPSPILAPERDVTGSLRTDDENVANQGGAGENPFKDRGAIDRVDFIGPTSELANPVDNDAAGVDGDPTIGRVSIGNVSLFSFDVQLDDTGIGIDDTSVLTTAVRVEETAGGVTRTLVDGTDYTFSYDRTNNKIILRPTSSVWTLGRNYRITLDNTGVDGIRDQAGNLLQPNRVNGTVVYDIFLGTAIDYGDAPASYGTTRVANGASHQIRGILKLGTQVSADVNGQPSANANADNFDDGLINYFLAPGQTSSLTVRAQGGGKLDAWLDRNKDGDFRDAGEHIIVGATLPHNLQKTLTFRFGTQLDVKGDTFLRLRYTSNGISSPVGPANDGEVEDYKVTLSGPKYQNPSNQLDVDNNGFVQPRDALLIVNLINNFDLDGDGIVNPNTDLGNPAPNPPPYYDVNGDGLITRTDADLVVNHVNSTSSSTTGSGTSDNHAPVLDDSPVTWLDTISSSDSDPAGTLIYKLVKTAVTDADTTTIRGIAITSSTGYGSGTWQYRFDKLPWTNVGKVSESGARLLPGRAYIRFVPNPGFSGEVTLRYRAWDQTQGVPGFLFNTTGNLGGSKAFSLASEIGRLRVTTAAAATSSTFASSSIVYEQNSLTPAAPEAPAVDAVFSTAPTITPGKQTYSLLADDEKPESESDSSTAESGDYEDLTDDFFANF